MRGRGNRRIIFEARKKIAKEKIKDSFVLVYMSRGNQALAKNEYAQAEVEFTNGINISPSAVFYSKRALARVGLRKFAEAKEDYRLATLFNKSPANFHALGIVHFHLQEFSEAIIAFNEAIALSKNPDNLVIFFQDRSRAHSALGEISKTIIDILMAMNLVKDNSNHLKKLKQILDETKDFSSVDKYLLFDVIKKLSTPDQVFYLKQCMDKYTRLGRRIWQQEGVSECHLTAGTAKDMYVYLKEIDKNFMMPEKTNYSPVLFNQVDVKKYCAKNNELMSNKLEDEFDEWNYGFKL